MKVYVRLNSGRSFKIWVPIGFVKAAVGLGSFGVSIGKKYIPEEQRQYIDCINFRELGKGLDVLRPYKGLKMVEVKTWDGTEITVVI